MMPTQISPPCLSQVGGVLHAPSRQRPSPLHGVLSGWPWHGGVEGGGDGGGPPGCFFFPFFPFTFDDDTVSAGYLGPKPDER